MHVNNLLEGLGAGFSGPRVNVGGRSVPAYAVRRTAPAPAPAPRPPATPRPRVAPRPAAIVPRGLTPGAGGALLPYFDPAKTFTYTREQMQEMIDRAKATAGEVETRQTKEGGDGIAEDLEQRAAEDAATDKAVSDSAGGTGLPTDKAEPAKQNFVPLAIAAALIYFMS